MSDEETDTAVSPELPEADEAKPLGEYVLVQHLQRWAGSRSLRAERGGHRRQGVLLDDGSRIRQKSYRLHAMPLDTLLANHQSMLEHVREGRLAVFDPDGTTELTYELLLAKLHKGLGKENVQEAGHKEAIHGIVAGVPVDPDLPPEIPPRGYTNPPEDVTQPSMETAVIAAEERKLRIEPEPEVKPAKSPHKHSGKVGLGRSKS
jgi:hypothetical protein